MLITGLFIQQRCIATEAPKAVLVHGVRFLPNGCRKRYPEMEMEPTLLRQRKV